MVRILLVTLGLLIICGACTQRMICPAYQSAFIYDKSELRKKFSYFIDDSTPRVLTASKNKYLIAEPVSYRKKIRSMQTVEMKAVPMVLPDSLDPHFVPDSLGDSDVSMAELDMAARSVMDTIMASGYQKPPVADTTKTAEDSVYVITKDKELRLLKYDPDSIKYHVVDVRLNVDQDNYMWYLRDYLILPDVRLAKMQQNAGNAAAKAEKKGIKGFFKNLFKKKKKKDELDSAEMAPPPREDEFDYVDEDTAAVARAPVAPAPAKKKGLFSFLKKKDKSASPAKGAAVPAEKPKKEKKKKEKKPKKKKDEPTDEQAPKEEEADDDGF